MHARDARTLRGLWSTAVALAVFARVELGLRHSTLPDQCRRLGVTLQTGGVAAQRTPRPATRDWVARQMRAVDRVARRWPFGDTCLRRCLVLGARLHHGQPVLVIGVRRDEAQALVAHSWLEFEGRPLDPTSRDFAVLRS